MDLLYPKLMNELTYENLKKLMQFRPTLKETANWFNSSEDTIERRIRKWEKMPFTNFKDKYSYNVKHKLIDRAIDMALTGNTSMMIFCLKNYCGWADKSETAEETIKPFTLAYSIESLRAVQNKE